MGESRREGGIDLFGLNIWWNLSRLRDPLRKVEQFNPAPWPQAAESRAYANASSLSRYSGGGPGSLQLRFSPRCASGFPIEF